MRKIIKIIFNIVFGVIKTILWIAFAFIIALLILWLMLNSNTPMI